MKLARGPMLLLAGALLAAPAAAQVLRATVEVQGMSCPFCAFGVEKRLGEVEGVGSVTVAMKEGEATVRARNGESINLQGIPEAVRRAGFTPGRVDVEAGGVLRSAGGGEEPGWLLATGEQEISLVDVSNDLFGRLADLARSETSVRLRGLLRNSARGRLELAAVEVIEAP